MSNRESLDPRTHALVDLAALLAQGDEPGVRGRLAAARAAEVPARWVEELLLQTYLMCGFPRMLAGFRLFREVWGVPADVSEPHGHANWAAWVERGEATCRTVYGEHYEALRRNVRALHPAVDEWMIVDGYGKVLGRPGLDLRRRELCIVAQVAVIDAPRQLRSHLAGALAAGALPEEVTAALAVVHPLLSTDHWRRVRELWARARARAADN
jgi:4-carboxymuconolactone decarboxylase